MTVRHRLGFRAVLTGWLALLVGVAWAGTAASDPSRPVVVELFTSQGCNSCPPADAILRTLTDREDVVALGFHVNYWDRLGWPDPFATRAGTERQYGYAPLLGRSNVYTPQMVVDGRFDVVGSYRERVDDAIRAATADADRRIGVALEWKGEGRIAYALPEGVGGAEVLLVRYAHRLEQHITRGENAGRRLAYGNVVRAMRRLARWDGAAMAGVEEIAVPAGEPGGVALLVQDRASGRMLGAAKLPF